MGNSKERNLLAGFDYLDAMGGVVSFAAMILNVFTVTVEVFLRKDMGQRYFNTVNFYAGMIVFASFASFLNALIGFGSRLSGGGGFSVAIYFVWLAYVVLSVFHFIRQWWREEAGKPVHSLHPGLPRLEPLGRIVMNIFNAILNIPVRIFSATLSAEEREDLPTVLPVFKDSIPFTYRIVEPLFLLILGGIVLSFSKTIGIWLLFSSVAMIFYANLRSEMERQQIFDYQDQIIEAAEMKPAMENKSEFMHIPHSTKQTMKNIADKIDDSPLVRQNIETFTPSIAEAMAAVKSMEKES